MSDLASRPSVRPDPIVAMLGAGDGPQALSAVYYEVPDLEAAVNWYAGLFGTTPLSSTGTAAVFDMGGDELVLMLGASAVCAPHVTVYWSVENLDDAFKRVERLGIRLVEPPRQRDAMTRTACIADPFGNIVGLMERDDPVVRRARSQRTAEKVALRNVRQTLDDLLREDEQKESALRVAAKILLAILAAVALVVSAIVGFRS